ncbi:MAG: hypothetical protein LH615_00940 [Ferruginibacter sp.]|nr:hypothetical protein [Ferruginibacter sp.]
MKPLLKILTILFFVSSTFLLLSSNNKKPMQKAFQPKIQVAILLDVSGSMDGLIEQAKSQLWNMVNTMGKATCANDVSPQIEIALYEYGRTTNNAKQGYVKKINGFINDLDSLSQNLFSLKTDGGDEFCGHVIYSSLNELAWDVANENYKVIFIAGNEDFLQGDVLYTKACSLAKQKGVIVNTIYCGNKINGIREHWNLAGECGNGSFTNINQDAKTEDIPTPYDSIMYSLNDKLNNTYVAYGASGYLSKGKQVQMDAANVSVSKSAGIKRIQAKSSKLYSNAQWDLVDAKLNDKEAIKKLDKKVLPDSLKNKTTEELELMVSQKSNERNNIQKEIAQVTIKREAFMNAEKVKNTTATNSAATLETEVEKIIRAQAKLFNMEIK